MSQHLRQTSMASSFVSTSANNTGITLKHKNPAKIGPWKLGKTLGKGATGRVFLATNVETGQKAAVKIVSKETLNENSDTTSHSQEVEDGCDSAGLSYGIEREIIIMKLLNHKNVLRLFDVWETDKALYLILEYVEGGELFDLLVENGPLPEQTAVEFFRQIILGSSYCHSLGICHRDLKPENILLDKDLNVKIADFGMAALESGRLLRTSCGSPHYAAPEIVSGLQYHGAESDVWSCGVILFALLTGRLPFDDDNIRNLLLKVQKGTYEIEEDLSPEAIDLIHKMLTVDPKQRIKTRDILKHPFIRRYYDCEKDETFNQLPSLECPVKSRKDIDKRILENLVILWHGRPTNSIVEALLSPVQNAEKTFYSLLLRYRHDHASNNFDKQSDDGLVRSSSVISKTTEPISDNSSPSSSSKSNNSNKSNKKRLSVTASSSFNRPVSFQFNNKRKRDSVRIKELSQSTMNRTSMQPLSYDYIAQSNQFDVSQNNNNILVELSNNRSSQLLSDSSTINLSKETTPTRNVSNSTLLNDVKRNSLIALDTPTKRKSSNPTEAAFQAMLTQQNLNPKSKLKRNSVTSKVLSAYATMAEYEKHTKSGDVENYGKRTSSDFAALCDVLFGDESKINNKIPNSESMATINNIVFGNKRNSKRFSGISNSPKKKNAKASKRQSKKLRNSSNPIERISKLLNANEFNDLERRTASDFKARSFDLVEPPKPMSRLDPRYKAYETFQKRSSQHAAHLLKLEEENEEAAKAEIEIKEREERLKKEQEELELLKNKKARLSQGTDLIDSDYDDDNDDETSEINHMINSGTVRRSKIKQDEYNLSNDFVPPPPRHAPNLKSNRYSTLSMLSTKNSSNRLSFYLRELDDEIAKTSEQKKKDRVSRLSMLINDNDIDNEFSLGNDEDHHVITTLKEDTEPSISDFTGKPRSASVSDVLDDDLCFISSDGTKNKQTNEVEKMTLKNNMRNDIESSDITKTSSVYEKVPKLASEDDTFNSSAENNKVGPKLPNIPGSPFKENKAEPEKTFEIFEDAVKKSEQEFSNKKRELSPSATANKTPVSKSTDQKLQNIEVGKQRKPLATKDDNNQQTSASRKTSFFSKLQMQPSTTERKSSIGKQFKALFSSQLSEPMILQTKLSDDEAFDALKTLVSGWKHYGIDDLVIDTRRRCLKGRIVKGNVMNVKPCGFSCVVTPINPEVSKITFNHDKGSVKSFDKIVGEIKRIFVNENVLVY